MTDLAGSPDWWYKLRHNTAFHVGLGDVRVTIGMQEDVSCTISTLQERNRQLTDALREIAYSKYCDYDSTAPNAYGTGVTDGHRYCASIARDVLKEN